MIGLVLLLVGTICLRVAWRQSPERAHRFTLLEVGASCALALLIAGHYNMSPTERVTGFPFLSFMFIKKRGMWLDYLGILTLPAMIANAYWIDQKIVG